MEEKVTENYLLQIIQMFYQGSVMADDDVKKKMKMDLNSSQI